MRVRFDTLCNGAVVGRWDTDVPDSPLVPTSAAAPMVEYQVHWRAIVAKLQREPTAHDDIRVRVTVVPTRR